jgi:hypothetical protein
MSLSYRVIESNVTGYSYPATYTSPAFDIHALGGTGCTIWVLWRDCSLTFFLRGVDYPSSPVAPYVYDFTADYRAADPAWVDPVLGDPMSSHPIRFRNLGFNYVYIGWSASDWTGANRFLAIRIARERSLR